MRLKKLLFLFVPLAILAIPALACISAADVDYIITGDSSVYGRPGTTQYAQPVYQQPAQQYTQPTWSNTMQSNPQWATGSGPVQMNDGNWYCAATGTGADRAAGVAIFTESFNRDGPAAWQILRVDQNTNCDQWAAGR